MAEAPATGHAPLRYRHEAFGGILSLEDPPLLAWVDRERMLALGLGGSPRWETPDPGHLSAPTEAHYLVTARCGMGCSHCYTSSTARREGELDTAGAFGVIDGLAQAGVFAVALGGGEALLREDLFAVAARARARGVTPNLTTSGAGLTAEMARACRVFGRVNLSLDAVQGEVFGVDRRAVTDRAMGLLREAGVPYGMNTVLGRANYEGLEALVLHAKGAGAADVELLRLKPYGRGREDYERQRLTPEQALGLFPRVLGLSRRHRYSIKMDCSFTPMIAAHRPPRRLMDLFCVVGCEAANQLLSVTPEGRLGGCSFVAPSDGRAGELDTAWREEPQFAAFRDWTLRAPEPCASCDYLDVCRGGCRSVAIHAGGGFDRPDPECPRVRRHRGET
ncbi:MAG: SPASM domain-containing protein [Planctomycetes bacterium]|nr:SPASM domain-containing protein [Planctomycetota bacterium]